MPVKKPEIISEITDFNIFFVINMSVNDSVSIFMMKFT